MKIYLIRHSSTIEGENNIILGLLDGNLSEKGISDAENTGNYLENEKFGIDVIITSKLKRAIDTGKIINKKLKLNIIENELINERGAGNIEGQKENIINWEKYEEDPLELRKHKGGESFIDVEKRVIKFVESLKSFNYNNILVISHSVVILLLIKYYNNFSLKDALKYNINNKIIIIDANTNTIESKLIY
ncbi:hypothetical protein EOM39_04785 [Candidatus Gracilibacteria bacterium]|nr:hypothetical protein [Candidatus Gracilibacteria bacterium]